MKKYYAYFDGSLEIEAESIEEAWEKWEVEKSKIKNIDIDDIDIWEAQE